MKILVDYKACDFNHEALKIDTAEYISDFVIKIKFSDGIDKLIDFKPFLFKSSHPSISKYLDEKKFSNFDLIDGNLNWNDYDLIFPLEDLYIGSIA